MINTFNQKHILDVCSKTSHLMSKTRPHIILIAACCSQPVGRHERHVCLCRRPRRHIFGKRHRPLWASLKIDPAKNELNYRLDHTRKKLNDHRIDEKKGYTRRRNFGKGLDSYWPFKKMQKKHHIRPISSAARCWWWSRLQPQGLHLRKGYPAMCHTINRWCPLASLFHKIDTPGAADSCASVFRPDFRPKRCHHPCTMPKNRDGNPTTTWLVNGSSLPMYSNV